MKFSVYLSREINLDIQEFIDLNPDGNFFQSTALFHFYQQLPGYKPILIIAKDDSGLICGSLLAILHQEQKGWTSFFSSRTIISGGPLINNDCKDKTGLANSLLQRLDEEVGHRCVYTEFRNLADTNNFSKAYISSGYQYQEHLNCLVPVLQNEDMLKGIKKSKQRQIKKSFENGAEISIAGSLKEVKDFYNILQKLYRNKIRKPLPHLTFFEHFFNTDAGVILLVTLHNKVIGGIVCPVFGKKTIYEWYIAAEDKKHKGVYPSVLATWAAIDYAQKNQIGYFDFLGMGHPDKPYGVRNFKLKFGGDIQNYGRYVKVNKPLRFFIGRSGLKTYAFLRSLSGNK